MITKISKKQASDNRELAKIKKELLKVAPFCIICGISPSSYCTLDLMHLLPKGKFPEHKTDPRNLALGCRGLGSNDCHNKYDNDIKFRKQQTKIIDMVKSFNELGSNQYFKLWEEENTET